MTKFDKNLILSKNPWLADVIILQESASTQGDAKSGNANSLFLTDHQTAAYGRFGREYFTPSQGGIYMSANLGPIDRENPVQYTLLAAAALVSAIEKLTQKKPRIKWVNDIYLDGKKMAGILAESNASAIILGIGFNFSINEFPGELADRATSLFKDETASISASSLVAEIWSEFDRLRASADYLKLYKAHCFVLGQSVSFSQNNKEYQGVASDLTEHGELVVDCTDGIQRILNSGEISLMK
ncbi:MAG: biotin--[acetyl-CoA-carboxylase] ligase [Streptococcaceae bacterium]|jgi:BirA family biotin operon repressor/biotin-[acetyl-CoA-carboxylase] ligase|nr:biotin--[acetyl-CoA-carboxylase] ligase [Streptococcaceae bacterium]